MERKGTGAGGGWRWSQQFLKDKEAEVGGKEVGKSSTMSEQEGGAS